LLAAGLVLLYIGLLAILWRFQEQIVFQPPSNAVVSSVSARQVSYYAADGTELFAYVVGECAPETTVVLAFHGNADLSRWLVPWAAATASEANVCVVLPEYRGYDGLAGAPTYDASSHDARAALEFVRDSLQAMPANTVYFGHSLGTAIAAELAASDPPRVLVLQAPFSSARAMAARMVVPGLTTFWRAISRVHFDTVRRVRGLTCPVWVAHGDKDMVIPERMGREVFAAAAHPGEYLVVHGAGHNNVAEIGGQDYWSWLRRAILDGEQLTSTRGAPVEK
jgi:pimeloyl-ACP methyl ester carboxylesterase